IRDADVRREFVPLLYQQFDATPSARPAFFRLNEDLLPMVRSRTQMIPKLKEFKRPVRIIFGGSGPLGDLDWLGAGRVRVALQTPAPFSAAVQAVYDTLKALREGVPPRELKNIAPPELMRRVTRADNYQQWTKDFLGGA